MTNPDSFLDVLQDHGYATQHSPKIPATFWTAVVEANLQITQQRVVKAYLKHHFGRNVVNTDKAIQAARELVVPYTTIECQVLGARKLFHIWSEADMMELYAPTIFVQKDQIEKLELLFGGNHGKGAFTFLFVVVVWYQNEQQLPNVL